MFSNIFSDLAWDKLGRIGQQWQLVRFSEKSPPPWESYWAEQRKYWSADATDMTRIRHYFGETDTEQNLLNDSRKKYKEFKEYLLHWNGLCKIGEVVQVIPLQSNVIALSKNCKREVSDHSDLEIWLKEEKTFLRSHVRFCCEIYSFGTIVVPKGGIEAAMGERVGSSRVSHLRGNSTDRNESVILKSAEGILSISDAHFRIIG